MSKKNKFYSQNSHCGRWFLPSDISFYTIYTIYSQLQTRIKHVVVQKSLKYLLFQEKSQNVLTLLDDA